MGSRLPPDMRLLKSSAPYSEYVSQFYSARPMLAAQSFNEQVKAVLEDSFMFGDSWKHYLEGTGQFEVMEVVVNAESAQRQWAKQHGLLLSEDDWQLSILEAQLCHFKPDVWFCMDPLPVTTRIRLRKKCPSIRCVIGWDGVLFDDPARFAGCDVMLSCLKETADVYSRAGIRGYFMRWGVDPRAIERTPPSTASYDVTFCGGIFLGGDHLVRITLLDHLRQGANLRVFVPILCGLRVERFIASTILRHGRFRLGMQILLQYPALRRLRTINLGERYGLDMFQTLAASKITLNHHGHTVKTAANIRLFEATAAGACLLTDWKEGLSGFFELDREVVSFGSSEECAEKVNFLLNHDSVRQDIAAAGKRRTLRDHNIGHRILEFANEVLRGL